MVSASFVPAEPMRQVRDLARMRTTITRERAREIQRLEKLLEDALLKIGSVPTGIHAVSGRAMIEALIAGTRDPKVLAEVAKGHARARLADLAEAVDGRFTDHHARLARMLLDQIDDLTGRIDNVTRLLAKRSPPCLPGLSPPPPSGSPPARSPRSRSLAPVPSSGSAPCPVPDPTRCAP